MKNRIAVAYCIHHKPWLIMSTLITTLAQDFKDYDMFFLYQEGDGTEANSDTYREYFKEYYALVGTHGINAQLDTYDPKTIEVCQITGRNTHELRFRNDHALDSGAWYKFIKTGLWQSYDYVMFLGEGALLTQETVLGDTVHFAQDSGIHFITGSQEKRRVPRERFLNGFISAKKRTEMTVFHDRMINETFNVFCRDGEFKKILETWSSDFDAGQEHHVPDIWARKRFWQRGDRIYVNAARKKLKDVVDYKKRGLTKFHKSNKPEWYGATCNHFVSREFLRRLSEKLEKHKIYDIIELPFSATALEIIWGLIPCWLGLDKWFFNGIHRVRKNFVTYKREDDPDGMVRYINRYYRGKIRVDQRDGFVKLGKCSNRFENMKLSLNHFYF